MKFKTALISTIEAKVGIENIDTGFHVTTPDSKTLQKLLKKCVDEGVEKIVLEATSHGLSQKRFVGVDFESAIFTNLAPDHLDYHLTFEKYFQAKAALFKNKKLKFSILNKDDRNFARLSRVAKGEIITYSLKIKTANYFAKITKLSPNGTKFTLIENGENKQDFFMPIPGSFYVQNALAAIALARQYGVSLLDLANQLKIFGGISGRMEKINGKQNFTVIVDFAHTPDSLKALLESVRPTIKSDKKIITVFGNAAKRDPTRRKMGAISAQLSDITILTAEDPRGEPVERIMDEAFQYGKEFGAKLEVNFFKIEDRRDAIKKAFEIAQKDDLVLICGKGHEKSMNYGKGEELWSDQEVVREELKKLQK